MTDYRAASALKVAGCNEPVGTYSLYISDFYIDYLRPGRFLDLPIINPNCHCKTINGTDKKGWKVRRDETERDGLGWDYRLHAMEKDGTG